MPATDTSDRDRAYQHMLNNRKPNLRQYNLDPREAVEIHNDGGFILPEYDDQIIEPYRDGAWRRRHSLTVASFLLGLPLPDPIIAARTPRDGSKGIFVVSGLQSLLSILTYLGCNTGHTRALHNVPIYPLIDSMELGKLTSVQVDEIMGMRTIPITFIETEHEETFEDGGIYGAGAVAKHYWTWNL